MQAAVKTPHTEIRIKGDIPQKILNMLRAEYGSNLHITYDEQSENIFETDWYTSVASGMTPGETIRIYRENAKMTQTVLGEKMGGFPRQHISNMERGIRPISVSNAKKLARIFNVPAERFLNL